MEGKGGGDLGGGLGAGGRSEKEADKCLRDLADRVRATDDYIDQGVELCEKVRLKLQEEVSRTKQPYSIAATHYAGSVGKRTDVVAPDFDLVLQINKRSPPFNDVLDFFQEKITEHAKDLKILPGSIQQTKINHALQFSFANGMEVDLLPATADMTGPQLNRKLKSLRQKKSYTSKDWIYFSSSFVKEQKGFMKEQSGFAHRVARLSKHWYKTLHFPGDDPAGNKITGGSAMFELLAVEAALHLEESGGEPMLKALDRVVSNVENIDQLKLAFKKDPKGQQQWRVMSGGDLLPEGRGQVSAVHGDNYIIEPSISANNLLKKMSPETKKVFKEHAGVMRARLQEFQEGRFGVDKLFEPLPLKLSAPEGVIPPVAYVTQATPKGEFRHTPVTMIRNKNVSPEQMKVAAVLTNRLVSTMTNVGATVCYNPTTKAEQTGRCKMMVGAARDIIKQSYPNMLVNPVGTKQSGVRMRGFDAVISVPYRSADGRCVMVGLGWSGNALANVDKNCFN